MRYHFIQKHNGQFRNSVMFRVLGICASAFYRWKTRPVSQRQQQKETLVAHINELFHDSDGRYGSPRIHRDLKAVGIKCSPTSAAPIGSRKS